MNRLKQPKTKLGRYLLNNFIAWDQKWNARFGGDPDETISSRLGKLRKKHGGKIPWYRPGARVLARFLDAIDENHCEGAIETDEGKDALFI